MVARSSSLTSPETLTSYSMVPRHEPCSSGPFKAKSTLGSTVVLTVISSPSVSIPIRAVFREMELIRQAAVEANAISTGSMRSVAPAMPNMSSTSRQAPNGKV